MNEISVIFDYKASGGEINGLEEFKKELKSGYLLSVRRNQGPQSGGRWDILVELCLNLPLNEFIIGAVGGGLLWDMVKIGTRNFVIRPIIESFEKLEKQNESIDYAPVFKIRFDDIQLIFYGFEKGFFSHVTVAFQWLLKNYSSILKLSEKELFKIHIPVLIKKEIVDNEIYVINPYYATDLEDFTKFWGLSYSLGFEKNVLDLGNLCLLDKPWEFE